MVEEKERESEDDAVLELDQQLKRLAKDDLREDDLTRSQALKAFRLWIEQNPDIKNCRTDSAFLLRFLRTKKFSVPLAQEMLERYLVIRQLYPKWFRNLDVHDAKIQEIIDAGYIFPLLERDDLGRQVIFSVAQNFDPYKYTSDDMARVHSIAVESLMDDHANQITGYTHINDESGLSMGHVSLWSFSDIKNMMRCIQYSTPMRHKCTHFLNVPPFATRVFDFVTNLLNEKLQNRVTLHKDVEDLKKYIDPKILPKEYGGTVPMADMIAEYKKKLTAMRDKLLRLDEMEIRTDGKSSGEQSRFANRLQDDHILGVAGSFRKLEVD